MTRCSQGVGESGKAILEEIWRNAKEDPDGDQTSQIVYACDELGDLALHKAAHFGHWCILEWMFQKAEILEYYTKNVDKCDSQGYTALFLACFKGYIGPETIVAKDSTTQENRRRCVKLLLDHGANPNFVCDKVKMTPLHWAAYNNDSKVAIMLMRAMHQRNEYQLPSASGAMPIDIAGFMKNKKVVNAIVDQHEMWMEEEKFNMKYPDGEVLDADR